MGAVGRALVPVLMALASMLVVLYPTTAQAAVRQTIPEEQAGPRSTPA